jgi:hypothetical protein
MNRLPAARAYSFESDFSIEEMQAVLNSRSGFAWKGADNDHWGEYLVARPRQSYSKLRIFVDESGRFVVDMSTLPGEENMLSYEALQEIVERDVVPVLNASKLEPHPGWE